MTADLTSRLEALRAFRMSEPEMPHHIHNVMQRAMALLHDYEALRSLDAPPSAIQDTIQVPRSSAQGMEAALRMAGYPGFADSLAQRLDATPPAERAAAGSVTVPESVQKWIRLLAEWEDRNGAMAGILEDEAASLVRSMANLAVTNSPRNARNAMLSAAPQSASPEVVATFWCPREQERLESRCAGCDCPAGVLQKLNADLEASSAPTDSEILDWAESTPERAFNEIESWWVTCGQGAREVRFNFRGVIKGAMRHDMNGERNG